MTTAQVSNLFNIIVQNTPDFEFYHFGWPNDMNLNTANNFDSVGSTGAKFPYLLMIPPRITGRVMESGTQSIYKTFRCEFLITDTYSFEQQTLGFKKDTSVDVLSKLEILAANLLNYVNQYSEYSETQFTVSDYQADLDPYRFAASTRSIRVSFDLAFLTPCPASGLDLSFLPASFQDLPETDLENTNPT